MFRFGDLTFVVVPEGGATVSHEEHKAKELPEGKYILDQVREFDPNTEAVRRVWD